MRAFTTQTFIKKRVIFPLWTLQVVFTTALFACALVEDIDVTNSPPSSDNGSPSDQTTDQLVATLLILLAFIVLVLHATELGFFLFRQLRTSYLVGLEISKTFFIEPAWVLLFWRLGRTAQGSNVEALVFVVLGLVTYVSRLLTITYRN